MRGHGLIAASIIVGLLVTWPGWYREATWNAVMTNAFATFLVTPVILLGVERGVAIAAEHRLRPRHAALGEDLVAALARPVNLAVSGAVSGLLPGHVARLAAFMGSTGVDELDRFSATEALARLSEYEQALQGLDNVKLHRVLQAVATERDEVRQLLFEARDSISPDQYASGLRAVRWLGRTARTAELVDYMAHQGDWDSSKGDVAQIRSTAIREFVEGLEGLANTFLSIDSDVRRLRR